jgi:branched-chain amino acid transport system ATP-binding protein
MTVLDNVRVAFNKDMKSNLAQSLFRTRFFWNEEEETTRKAMELLKLFKLEAFADQYAENLPYGKQRLLEIARALATDMKLLLLDEPAAGMNPVETAELKESIKMLREKFQIPILLIEHDMSLVMSICERIYVLNFGEILASGLPNEIANNKDVIEAYLGKEDDEGDDGYA